MPRIESQPRIDIILSPNSSREFRTVDQTWPYINDGKRGFARTQSITLNSIPLGTESLFRAKVMRYTKTVYDNGEESELITVIAISDDALDGSGYYEVDYKKDGIRIKGEAVQIYEGDENGIEQVIKKTITDLPERIDFNETKTRFLLQVSLKDYTEPQLVTSQN